MPRISKKQLFAPKCGHSLCESEDFGAMRQDGSAALSDGATNSFLSAPFARALVVRTLKARGLPVDLTQLSEIAERAASHWRSKLPELSGISKRRAERGAHATLVALTILRNSRHFERTGSLVYLCQAVGDSTFFHLRNNRLVSAFPCQFSRDFGSTPELFSSLPDGNREALPYFKTQVGYFVPGDKFVLATDALSRFLLEEVSLGRSPWCALVRQTQTSFQALVSDFRALGQLEDDDTSILIGEVRE